MLQQLLRNKNFAPTLICIGLIFAVALVYFNPLLQGKVMQQYDIIQAKGPQQDVLNYREKHNGEDALWVTTMFSGMPANVVHIDSEGNIIREIRKVMNLGLPDPIGTFFWGMVGFFCLLRVFGVGPWLALGGAFAFGFYSYFTVITEAGHVTKFMALMYAPGVLFGVALALRGRMVLGAALLALAMGLEIYANHPQMTYYLAFIIVGYGIYELVRYAKEGKIGQYFAAVGLMVLAVGIGIAISASSLMPLYEYSKYSIRSESELAAEPEVVLNKNKADDAQPAYAAKKGSGLDKDYAYAWSNSKDELLTLLIPNAKGGGGQTYWGLQSFTSGPTYAGAIVCLLFVIGMCLAPAGLKWALFYPTALLVILSLGRNSLTLPQTAIVFLLPVLFELTKDKIKFSSIFYGAGLALVGFVLVLAINPADPMKAYKIKDLFFDFMPVYNKFRAPASLLSMTGLGIALLAMLGAKAFFDANVDKTKKLHALYVSAGLTAGVCLLLLSAPEMIGNDTRTPNPETGQKLPSPFAAPGDQEYLDRNLQYIEMQVRTGQLDAATAAGYRQQVTDTANNLQKERRDMLTKDAGRSLGFVFVAAVLLLAFGMGWVKNEMAIALPIGLLILIDLYTVDKRYLTDENYAEKNAFESNFIPNQVDQALLAQDKGYYRVFPLSRNPFNDGKTPYTLRSIGGYSAAKVKRYQQLIEAHISRQTPNVLNMLNTKYIIYNRPGMQFGWRQMNQQPSAEGEYVFENTLNYGPAWFVQDVKVQATPDSVLWNLDRTDSRQVAMIEKKDEAKLGAFSRDPLDSTETIKLLSFDNRLMAYETQSPKARFATFSEIYYPAGWTATIDGQEVPILQTNFVLRGLVVPAGKHKVEFRYAPSVIAKSAAISWAGSIGLLLFLAAAVGLEVVKGRKRG